MKRKDDLTAEAVRERFHYDPQTGHLIHRYRVGKRRPGERGGIQKPYGYRHIHINGREYLEHRVIWLYAHGEWPKHTIDHINQNPADNRLENLRDVTVRENCQNKTVVAKSEVKNVRPSNGKFVAYTHVNGKQVYLGRHGSAGDARLAYERFIDKTFGAKKVEVAA